MEDIENFGDGLAKVTSGALQMLSNVMSLPAELATNGLLNILSGLFGVTSSS